MLFAGPLNIGKRTIQIRPRGRVARALFQSADDALGDIKRAVTKSQINLPLDGALFVRGGTTFRQPHHINRRGEQHQQHQGEEAKNGDPPPRGSVNEIAERFKHILD